MVLLEAFSGGESSFPKTLEPKRYTSCGAFPVLKQRPLSFYYTLLYKTVCNICSKYVQYNICCLAILQDYGAPKRKIPTDSEAGWVSILYTVAKDTEDTGVSVSLSLS